MREQNPGPPDLRMRLGPASERIADPSQSSRAHQIRILLLLRCARAVNDMSGQKEIQARLNRSKMTEPRAPKDELSCRPVRSAFAASRHTGERTEADQTETSRT